MGDIAELSHEDLLGEHERLAMRHQAVRLVLAACFGKGAEERDIMDLAVAVTGELLERRQVHDDLCVALENLSSVAAMVPECARRQRWTQSLTGFPFLGEEVRRG